MLQVSTVYEMWGSQKGHSAGTHVNKNASNQGRACPQENFENLPPDIESEAVLMENNEAIN